MSSITDNKIAPGEVTQVFVQRQDDRLHGTPTQNKKVFDEYPDLIRYKHNAALDAIEAKFALNDADIEALKQVDAGAASESARASAESASESAQTTSELLGRVISISNKRYVKDWDITDEQDEFEFTATDYTYNESDTYEVFVNGLKLESSEFTQVENVVTLNDAISGAGNTVEIIVTTNLKGKGIADTELNDDYTLTINYDDGTSMTTESIRGEKGEKGDKGDGVYDDTEVRSDIAVLESRVDSFTHLTEGSTTGDAELTDIRVGADGTTYPNAGDSVRGQTSKLRSDLDVVTNYVNTVNSIITASDGLASAAVKSNGNTQSSSVYDLKYWYKVDDFKCLSVNYDLHPDSTIVAIGYFSANSFVTANLVGYQKSVSNGKIYYIPEGTVYIALTCLAGATPEITFYGSKVEDNSQEIIKINAECDEVLDSITPKNLVDGNWTEGYYISPSTGALNGNSSYSASDYIPIDEKTVLSIKKYGNTSYSTVHLALYDASKNRVEGASLTGASSYDGLDSETERYYKAFDVSGAKFIRISTTTSDINGAKLQVENGTEATEYEPHFTPYHMVKRSALPDLSGLVKVGMDDLTFVKWENLFNHEDSDNVVGKYLSHGYLSDNPNYVTSHFIEVEPNTEYSFFCSVATYNSNAYFVTEYNADKTYIKYTNDINHLTTGQNTKYVRFCISPVSIYTDGYVTMVEGDVPDMYAEHKKYIPADLIGDKKETVDVFLPSDIYVAVGRTIELYNELVCLQANKYHFFWKCNVGVGYARKFSITGQTTGDYSLKLTIVDDDLKTVYDGTATIHVVPNTIDSLKNIVPIGDSLTNIKKWQPEVIDLSDSKVMYIGTRNGYEKGESGVYHNYKHEGRSGASAAWYLGNNTYTYDTNYVGNPDVDGTSNPFWDGSKFSLQHYIDTQSATIGTPDAVQLFLGTNGMSLDPTANAGNIKSIVDAIRVDDANIPIFVCYTIYRSNQNGYYDSGGQGYVGTNTYQYIEDKKVFNLMSKLGELLDGYTDVYMIPLATCMDREHDFGQKPVPVNPRLESVTENIPNESVHPQAVGYYQIADVMFSTYCAAFND